jgi:DNA-binding transcriptional MerR regulator
LQKGRGASSESSTGSGSSAERTRSTRKPASPSEEEARRLLAESSKLYYRIGEVSELTGVKAHVLRYWETEFRWMAPPKSRSKQRLYRKRDIEFVWLLKKLLWEQRFTIAGARQRIQELGLEEALARSADAESSESFFTAEEAAGAAIAASGSPGLPADVASPDRHESSGGAGPVGADWLGIRIALDGMQAELLALRGALQQGL